MAIADDERPARSFLRNVLSGFDDVVIVGAAATGDEALALVEREQPDVLLLDVQMPGLDGFGLVHMLNGAPRPVVVFVTAFHEYADLAAEVGAIGYLHKPVSPDELATSLQQARRRLAEIEASEHAVALRSDSR